MISNCCLLIMMLKWARMSNLVNEIPPSQHPSGKQCATLDKLKAPNGKLECAVQRLIAGRLSTVFSVWTQKLVVWFGDSPHSLRAICRHIGWTNNVLFLFRAGIVIASVCSTKRKGHSNVGWWFAFFFLTKGAGQRAKGLKVTVKPNGWKRLAFAFYFLQNYLPSWI